jgi:hypothetical protein
MDYMELFRNPRDHKWTLQDFDALVTCVIGRPNQQRFSNESERDFAIEVLEDLVCGYPAAEKKRAEILDNAHTSLSLLLGLKKAVRKSVQLKRFKGFRKQIYDQISDRIVTLEGQGILISTSPVKRSEPVRTILKLRREGHSSKVIAGKLNIRGDKHSHRKPWTAKAVSSMITQFGEPKKRIGLAKWGGGWLNRIPERSEESIGHALPTVPTYQGSEGTGLKESKVFDYSLLESLIPQILELYGADMTLGQITAAVVSQLFPPLYEIAQYVHWPEEGFLPDKEEHRMWFSTSDHLACSTASFEDDIHTRDFEKKLVPLLDNRERTVFYGLKEGKSKRALAKLCACAPGTIDNIRMRLEAKASRQDPVVRARARQILGNKER